MTFRTDPSATCPCCSDLLRGQFSRRGFMQGAAAAGAVLAMSSSVALAASGNYEAMVLSCIDPRLQEPVRRYTARRGLTGKYSHFVIAGAAIGVVAEPFKDWHKAFWDNLAASVQLHNIKRVIAIDHRDCGAAKIAYGADKVANPKIETATHRAALDEFRKQMAARQPALKVETGLMAINGRFETLA
ncbi:MAG: twin-arginine translocation signal domain-containing protein [Xanthobacteraceae bacterium]|nr:twin-arginine translocation signal domain-containing protein [Xanthobacteraceae bacterium]